MQREIAEYYRRLGEQTRLGRADGRLEFARTRDVLARVLPPPPATVLDVGGATGAYAGPLAAEGYRVHVVDPVAEHVAVAAALPGVTAALGDARRLAEPDGSFDAVLLFGPLYHLLDRGERVAAWREAGRVVRPGGVVVAATISRFASLLDGYAKGYDSEPEFVPVVWRDLATGEHRTPDEQRYFTTAYFHHPDELPGEVAAAGLELERVLGVEGPLWMLVDRLDALLDDPARGARLLDQLRAIEEERTLLGASSHLLSVARRRP
jgi:SAM-dependent methyltransferase